MWGIQDSHPLEGIEKIDKHSFLLDPEPGYRGLCHNIVGAFFEQNAQERDFPLHQILDLEVRIGPKRPEFQLMSSRVAGFFSTPLISRSL